MSHDSWRRFLLIAMLVSLSWALLIWATGGFAWETSRLRLASRDPVRPLALGILAALLYWYIAPAACVARAAHAAHAALTRAIDGLERAISGNSGFLALAAAAATLAAGVIWGTYAAGGADSYGYVSQADLWLAGHLKIDQSGLVALGSPFDDRTFAPLGYRPGQDAHTIVPIYSPGLPLLMAAAKIAAGSNGPFLVAPLLGSLAVLLTFLLGRLLFDRLVGAGAAVLLAASPAFVMQVMSPMSDVPAAAAWTLALVFAVCGRPLGAGFASSLAIAIRPNLVPLGLAVGLVASFGETLGGGSVRGAASRAILFAAAALPGAVGIAALNTYLYGGPLVSGYDSLAGMYRWTHFPTNLRHYSRWLFETQTPLVLAAVLPLAFRRFTIPRTLGGHWQIRAGLALFLVLLAGSYFFYQPFGEWWYLRFLLPGLPLVLVLAVGFVRRMTPGYGQGRAGGPWRGEILLVTGVVASVFVWEAMAGRARGVYKMRTMEQRYVTIGRELATHTPPNAIVYSMQESGSVRYYAGRMTVRYDLLPPGSLDRSLDVLRSHGLRPYFLVERWEEPAFVERFGGTSLAGRLDWPPARKWTTPGEVALYDPSER